MKKTFFAVLSAALVICFGASCVGCSMAPKTVEKKTYNVMISETNSETDLSQEDIFLRIRPTVVDVTSTMEAGTSAGSGVIIAGASESDSSSQYEEYFIITNHHVIDGGTSFKADVLSIASDGTETTTAYEASLVGSSMKRDIAVLSIRPPEGTSLSMASFIDDSDKVRVGTEVYAIGNPLGILGGTVTHGIVSATKRDVNVGEIGTMTLMQTDASINGGNSGGGLFDTKGNLIGIINSGYDTYNDQSVEGLNFAITANDAKFAAQELIKTHEEENGKVTKYGYVEGDSRMDITFSAATLFNDSSLRTRGNYLVAAAASAESPLYEQWGQSYKVILSVTVNGEKTEFNDDGGSSYTLSLSASKVIASIKAGESVSIEYKNVVSRGLGIFGASYNYVDGEARKVTFTAVQYIYQP